MSLTTTYMDGRKKQRISYQPTIEFVDSRSGQTTLHLADMSNILHFHQQGMCARMKGRINSSNHHSLPYDSKEKLQKHACMQEHTPKPLAWWHGVHVVGIHGIVPM